MFPTYKIEKLRLEEGNLLYVAVQQETSHSQQASSVVQDGWQALLVHLQHTQFW